MKSRLSFKALIIFTVLLVIFLIGWGSGSMKKESHFSLVKSVNIDSGANWPDEPRGIVLDKKGNLFATGYITVPGEGKNIWLAKYNSNLVNKESTTLNGIANDDDVGYAIASDGDGYLYVIGYISDHIGQDRDIWIGKYDANLALQKQTTVNGSENSSDEGYGIIFDGDGNLYVAGTVTEIGQGYNIWIAKYDTDLNLQIEFTLNGPGNNTDKARFLTFDGSGDLFISGSVTQAVTGYDIWLGKFDTDLHLLKQTIIAGPTDGEDKGYGILFDGIENLYVTGTLTEIGQGYNIWLAKYDTELNLQQSVTLNGPLDGEEVAYSIDLDKKGRLYQTGVYTEIVGGSNIWIARYNLNLELQDYTTINGTANGYDTGLGIITGKSKDIYLSASLAEISGGVNIWLARYKVLP